MVNFYNIDCMEFMRDKPNKCYDLAVPDPVYGINGNSHRNNKSRGKCTKSKNYHNELWNQKKTAGLYFDELKRVSKNQLIFGGNYFPEVCGTEFKTPRRNDYENFILNNPKHWIIWDKVNSTTDFNDCELIWCSFPIKTEIFYFMWSGMMQGISFKRGTEINPFKEKNQKRIHPTEKPFEVYKYLFSKFCSTGMILLDTHGGCLGSGLVAYIMGINIHVCEIDKTYFTAGLNRFNNHKRQLTLF